MERREEGKRASFLGYPNLGKECTTTTERGRERPCSSNVVFRFPAMVASEKPRTEEEPQEYQHLYLYLYQHPSTTAARNPNRTVTCK
ncbi:hypothetical protein CGMCC3_g3770 [Colletotrichum fructicola]|nr:uncharacterized protein CGMCC3_g3770 [Colletotrichum fructicola]KAE9580074.1 hypothetical protein CGMCC3_g3770 [Colletotrichum fructicola]